VLVLHNPVRDPSDAGQEAGRLLGSPLHQR
jgi:hypothetical protein